MIMRMRLIPMHRATREKTVVRVARVGESGRSAWDKLPPVEEETMRGIRGKTQKDVVSVIR